jgi:hypothetical protein
VIVRDRLRNADDLIDLDQIVDLDPRIGIHDGGDD